MPRHLQRLQTLLIPLLLGFVSETAATTVVRFPFDSLCVRAERIAHVRCLRTQSFRDAQGGGIFTQTVFEVLNPIKGDSVSKEIVLILPGGRVEGQRLLVPGMPEFSPHQESVLFLTGSSGTDSPWPVGLSQGWYEVLVENQDEPQVVLQAGETPMPDGSLFKPSSHRPFTVLLDDFLTQIRSNLSALDPPLSSDHFPR